MSAEFTDVRHPAPDLMCERMAQRMETWLGKSSLDGVAVYHHCLNNVREAWESIGATNTYDGPAGAGTAWECGSRIQGKTKLNKTPPPRGTILFWDSSIGSGAGHIAIADGKGNSVNNWGGSTIERTPLSEQKSGYRGWVHPKFLGGNPPNDKDLKNPNYVEDADSAGSDSSTTGSTDDATSDQSEQLFHAGDFSKVKAAFSTTNLRTASFNPPLPRRWNQAPSGNTVLENMLRAQMALNKPGFIVLDPLYMGENTQSLLAEQARQTSRNDLTRRSDPDLAPTSEEAGQWLKRSQAWGFRFLYNPTEYNEGYTSINDADPVAYSRDIASGMQAVVGASGGSISLNLMLYRKVDVDLLRALDTTKGLENVDSTTIYGEQVSVENLRRLMTQGTLTDLEYLFRVCNGDPQDTWHGLSSDWGILLPTAVVVSLGDGPTSRRLRAMLTGASISHNLFAAGMVPVQTEVSLTLSRITDQYFTSPEGDSPSPDSGPSDTSPVGKISGSLNAGSSWFSSEVTIGGSAQIPATQR